ncbi:Putative LOC101846883 [Caligus rogercresseyi]|uniref:LOC101846883 n=1 Tax=Caligus rogercresseyi TaxID=217165 RepID=A0A7T8QTQ1_CALRO|nr:Putative LOC101846883 [Caligus rogercresseyi]QQP54666.1 Putative LOC101846883 [Caligus rogercresseyi]QQP54679.1 Putative LOC101846883 [Caligus rogercresseyi]
MDFRLFVDEDIAVAFCRDRGLITRTLICPSCLASCKETKHKGKIVFRCTKKVCQKVFSILIDSIFAKCRLPITKILHILYLWSCPRPVRDVVREVGVTKTTVVDWGKTFRAICTRHLRQHSVPLGGPGRIVEIDESKFGNRKYNRGRVIDGHWVFGGVERGPGGACFLLEVEDRSVGTLLPMITDRIAQGSTIMSDGFATYRRISDLGYNHLTVIHKRNFVDPLTGAHTQSIESLWAQVKKFMRQIDVMNTSRELFQSYLDQFCVRRLLSNSDIFNKMLDLIAEQYHPPIGIGLD